MKKLTRTLFVFAIALAAFAALGCVFADGSTAAAAAAYNLCIFPLPFRCDAHSNAVSGPLPAQSRRPTLSASASINSVPRLTSTGVLAGSREFPT